MNGRTENGHRKWAYEIDEIRKYRKYRKYRTYRIKKYFLRKI